MKNIQENKYWIWLSLIPNLGSIKKQRLLERFKNPENIYKKSKEELFKVEGIGEKVAEQILNIKIRESVKKHIEYLEKNKIQLINIYDEEYPRNLKEIYDYPISIYAKGNISLLKQKCIAIIGCRDASKYGNESAKYFGYNLAKEGICVVSGLAKGIDSQAHIGALGAKRKYDCSTWKWLRYNISYRKYRTSKYDYRK